MSSAHRGKIALRSLLAVLMLALGISTSPASADTGSEIANLPVLDALERTENPLSNEESWFPLKWAGGGVPPGRVESNGWGPADAHPLVNGASWELETYSSEITSTSGGNAVAVTMNAGPSGAARYVSLWLDMPSPSGQQSGYQFKWTVNSGSNYTVQLLKWASGSSTTLATNSSVNIAAGSTLAVSKLGNSLYAWLGTGTSLIPILTATDSTYTSGYVGIEGSGNGSRSAKFRAGELNRVGYEIGSMPVVDDFKRTESPLSKGGDWNAFNWTGGTTKAGRVTTSGWGPGDSFSTVNGAYLSSLKYGLNDKGGGSAAVVTIASDPEANERYVSLWLNAPAPSLEKSGYQLKWTATATEIYTVALLEWTAGSSSTLASRSAVSIPDGTTLAISKVGETVAAWMGKGGNLISFLDASDNTYTYGVAGIEGSGNLSRSVDFRAGSIRPAGAELVDLPTRDTLKRTEDPLSNEGRWSAMGWSGSSKKTGKATTEGWTPTSSSPTYDGAYWNPAIFTDAAGGQGASVTKEAGSGFPEQSGALWLSMPEPNSKKSGYRVAWYQEAAGTYALILENWEAGALSQMGGKEKVSIPNGHTIAISDTGSQVAAWLGSGNTLTPIIVASNEKYSYGYAGIEGRGSSIRTANFKAGTFDTELPFVGLPLLDALDKYDYPLSGKGKWSQLNWVKNTGGVLEEGNRGWRAVNPKEVGGEGVSGAYWNPTKLSSAGNGNGVSVEVAKLVNNESSYQSLWLNMSSPGSSKSGYEFSWRHEPFPSTKHELVLSRWDSGKQTILTSKKGVLTIEGSAMLLNRKGVLTAWMVDGSSLITPYLGATDTTYTSGYAGMQAGGLEATLQHEGKFNDFRAGEF